jgi:6-phosphogluconolactonase
VREHNPAQRSELRGDAGVGIRRNGECDDGGRDLHQPPQYAYVVNNGSNTVSQHVIESDGTLAPNTPATITTGHGPWAVTISPSGAWAYVANSTDNTISQFSINASGSLVATANAPVATRIEPWNITLSPDGKYVYVANHGDLPPGGMTISQYAVGAATGRSPR